MLRRSESVFDTVPGKNLHGRLDLQAQFARGDFQRSRPRLIHIIYPASGIAREGSCWRVWLIAVLSGNEGGVLVARVVCSCSSSGLHSMCAKGAPMTTSSPRARRALPAALFAVRLALAAPSIAASNAYDVTNLVSDVPGAALKTDPHLVNGWGVAFNPYNPGYVWVVANHTGVSTLYDGQGNP